MTTVQNPFRIWPSSSISQACEHLMAHDEVYLGKLSCADGICLTQGCVPSFPGSSNPVMCPCRITKPRLLAWIWATLQVIPPPGALIVALHQDYTTAQLLHLPSPVSLTTPSLELVLRVFPTKAPAGKAVSHFLPGKQPEIPFCTDPTPLLLPCYDLWGLRAIP